MQAGLGALRLAPQVFWAMTPRELDAALKGAFGFVSSHPMSRAELSVLMKSYPDTDPCHAREYEHPVTPALE